MQAELLNPITQYGAAVGSAIICTSMFVWSQIQMWMLSANMKEHMKDDKDSFSKLENLIVTSIETQRVVANSLERIAEAIQHQTESHTAQLDFLREMSSDQKVMLSNQATAQTSQQRLLEQMVTKLYER
jgi:hypothetical protein